MEKPSKEIILDLYVNQKLTMLEIRKRFHVDMKILRNWFHEYQIPIFNLLDEQRRKSKRPSKEQLQAHFDAGQTGEEIANIYQVRLGSIYRWSEELGCVSSKATYKYDDNRKIEFSDLQKEFLIGTILGDGHLAQRASGSVRLMITHCEKQKDYILFAKQLLIDFVPRKPKQSFKRKKDGTLAGSFSIDSICHPFLKEIRNIFYIDNIKYIPNLETIKPYLTPFALAVLVMDDGWRNKDKQYGISSEGFGELGNIKLQSILKEVFNLECKVSSYFRRNKRYYYLMFTVVESKKLSAIIQPHMLPCFHYKLIPC